MRTTKTYTESVNFRLKPELKAWLEAKAKADDRSINAMVNRLLEQLMLAEQDASSQNAA